MLTFLSPWGGSWCSWGSPRTHADLPVPMGGVLVPVLGLRRGPGAAGGPHASVLTFLSPWGGSWCSWGSPCTHADLLVPMGGS